MAKLDLNRTRNIGIMAPSCFLCELGFAKIRMTAKVAPWTQFRREAVNG